MKDLSQTNKVGIFVKKHWIDAIVIAVVAVLLFLLGRSVFIQFNFKGKIDIFNTHFIENAGYLMVWNGLKNTFYIALSGFFIGFVFGTVIAVIGTLQKYKRIVRYAQAVCNVYVAFFRGTPIVVQILLEYYLILPLIGVSMTPVVACIIVFGLNSAAYMSEIMRGGINSVDKGQLEAARSLGLPFTVSMVKVVIPQAFKNILPTLGNELIALIKETAIVGYVGAIDVTKAFQDLASNSYEYMVPYITMALIYIVIVIIITAVIKFIERRLAKSESRYIKRHRD